MLISASTGSFLSFVAPSGSGNTKGVIIPKGSSLPLTFSWSSHPRYISNTKQWEWLHKDFLLSMISGKKSKRKSAYIDFITQAEPEEIERFYSLKNLPSTLGSDSFKEWVPSPKNIIALVCDHFKIKKEQIAVSKRETENLPRDVAIYLVRHHNRDTLTKCRPTFWDKQLQHRQQCC